MNRLRLHVFTIVLDGMPWLPAIFVALNQLHEIEWQWTIVEGAAMNVKDTAWCQKRDPRLSRDGTHEFLSAVSWHPRVRHLARAQWMGKVEQCNAALETFEEDGVLMQVDADELWTADQFRRVVECFEDDPGLGAIKFRCRYFVGPNLVTCNDSAQNVWERAWRYSPQQRFATHEPPTLSPASRGKVMDVETSAAVGLVFDHYSYATRSQCAEKAGYYGPQYATAVEGWERLQRVDQYPARLKMFFPWVGAHTLATELFT